MIKLLHKKGKDYLGRVKGPYILYNVINVHNEDQILDIQKFQYTHIQVISLT